MQAKRINKWLNSSELKNALKVQNILDWLNEDGSITARISSNFKFKLEILSDDIGVAEDEEYLALNIISEEVRIPGSDFIRRSKTACVCEKHYPKPNIIKRLSRVGDNRIKATR